MKRHVQVNCVETSLESVAHQFREWRTTRQKRSRIPDTLWALIPPLMNKYSQNKIATALSINTTQLKENVIPLLSNKSSPFVECTLPLLSSTTNASVFELCCKNGAMIKMTGLSCHQIESLIITLMRE